MSHGHHVVLSTGDFTLLDSARFSDLRESLPDLNRKLDAAMVVFPADVPPDVVTTGRSITYRIGDGPPMERTVGSHPAAPGELPLLSPLGVALIGLRIGQSVTFRLEDGADEKLTVARVGELRTAVQPADRPPGEGNQVLPFRRRLAAAGPQLAMRPDDDPGPSAA